MIRDHVDLELQEQGKKELELDGQEGHDFWEWFDDECRGSLDTFSIDSHEIDVPAPQFNDRELNTVLHALRSLQERREPVENGCIAADDMDPQGGSSCDHFEEVQPLNNKEIDALCERLNLAPEQPQEKAPYVPNAVELGFIEYARENLATDDLEIDDGPDCKGNYPKVSQGADGAFVAAWVWVTNEQAGVTKEEESNG